MALTTLLTAVLTAGCATGPYRPAGDEPFYGAWVDEEGGLTIFYPDGTGMLYTNRSDPEPAWECRFTIEEKWADKEGNIRYRVLIRWTRPPYKETPAAPWRVSVRIHPDGAVMESAGYQGTCWPEIVPGDRRYTLRHRQ